MELCTWRPTWSSSTSVSRTFVTLTVSALDALVCAPAGAATEVAPLFELLSGAAPVGTERVHPIELHVRASTRPLS